MGEREMAAAQRARAERDRLEAGAQALRHSATQDAYAGARKPEVAYALASVIDLVSLNYASIPEVVRREVLAACDMLTGDAPSGSPSA